MCGGTSCSQHFYTARGKGAWETRGPQSSGIEIIKRSCDYSVSLIAHTGPENKTKSPYHMQTRIHQKRGQTDFCIFVRSQFISFSSELSFLTFLNYIQFLSRFGSVMTLWVRDRDGGGRGSGESSNDSLCDSLTYPFLAKIENNYFPCLGVMPWHLVGFFLLQLILWLCWQIGFQICPFRFPCSSVLYVFAGAGE